LHPKSHKHFEILFNGLEKWRIKETRRINVSGFSEQDRITALADLMAQESALLQKIDKLKIRANEENKERSIIRLLDEVSLIIN
jgi:hypothetical protein